MYVLSFRTFVPILKVVNYSYRDGTEMFHFFPIDSCRIAESSIAVFSLDQKNILVNITLPFNETEAECQCV